MGEQEKIKEEFPAEEEREETGLTYKDIGWTREQFDQFEKEMYELADQIKMAPWEEVKKKLEQHIKERKRWKRMERRERKESDKIWRKQMSIREKQEKKAKREARKKERQEKKKMTKKNRAD